MDLATADEELRVAESCRSPAVDGAIEPSSGAKGPALGPPAAPPTTYRQAPATWQGAEACIVRELFRALNEAAIRYCHWKSNVRLGETLAGDQDIDLLVDRKDLAELLVILGRCRFKTTCEHASLGHSGVFHALALDEPTGRLVDLHVYLAIVGGDSLAKTYRFPLVDWLLDEVTTLADIRVPRPEIELLMFVVRTTLKHTSIVEILKVTRHYDETRHELAWLRDAADAANAEQWLERIFPPIDGVLFRRLIDAIADERALPRRIALAFQVARRLRPYRRIGRAVAFGSRAARLVLWLRGKAMSSGHLSLTGGGAVIAIVGPKGIGKSTLAGCVAERLGRHLAVFPIHAGRPPATVLTLIPRLFLPIARRLLPHERLSEYEKQEKRQRQSYSLFHVARMCQLAYDRSRLLSRAFRASACGSIVISDRYPSSTSGAIDSRAFDEVAIAKARAPLKRMLMRWEGACYRDMPTPDIVLRLVAPIETAIARDATRKKAGGPDAAAVSRRWDLETSAEYPSAKVFELDNTASLEDAAREAVRVIWTAL